MKYITSFSFFYIGSFGFSQVIFTSLSSDMRLMFSFHSAHISNIFTSFLIEHCFAKFQFLELDFFYVLRKELAWPKNIPPLTGLVTGNIELLNSFNNYAGGVEINNNIKQYYCCEITIRRRKCENIFKISLTLGQIWAFYLRVSFSS